MSETAVTGQVLRLDRTGGQLVVQVAIDPEYQARAEKVFCNSSASVALVRLANSNLPKLKEVGKGPYKEFAEELKSSGLFEFKDFWRMIGPDSKYLLWLRLQPCAITGVFGHDNETVDPAHVRRVSGGAGTGIKPEYSCIPLLHSLHHKQHNQGESSITPENHHKNPLFMAYADKVDMPPNERINYLSWWSWQSEYWVSKWALERFEAFLAEHHKVPDLTWLDPQLFKRIAHENDAIWNAVPELVRKLDENSSD